MGTRTYTVGVLKKFIQESTSEFKPKLGSDVTSSNKKNNEKAIKDIEKETSKYDGGITNKKNKVIKIGDNQDYNKTTLDLQFDEEPSKEYKERVKSQVHGFPSKTNETYGKKTASESDADFEGNEEIYDDIKKRNVKVNTHQKDIKKSGLKAREMPSKQFDDGSVFENKTVNKTKMKKLNFKYTQFISEKHMLSRVPEEYKTDGNKFIMKDAADNEYLIEWIVDTAKNISEATIISHKNQTQLNEDLKRINQLFEYKSSDFFNTTNAKTRITETNKLGNFINDVRKLTIK